MLAGVDPSRSLSGLASMESSIAEGKPEWISSLPNEHNHIAVRYYLMGNHERAREHAQAVIKATLNYYFGDWRKTAKTDDGTIDPDWWHDKEAWTDAFRYSLCWGSVLGDWSALRKLSAYPDDRRSTEKFGIDKKPAMRQLLLDVAKFLRGENVSKVRDRVAHLTGAEWRGTDALAGALDAIIARDPKAANLSLQDYFARHHKRKKSKDITDTVSMDGTFMVNLARLAGLLIEINPQHEIYIIKL